MRAESILESLSKLSEGDDNLNFIDDLTDQEIEDEEEFLVDDDEDEEYYDDDDDYDEKKQTRAMRLRLRRLASAAKAKFRKGKKIPPNMQLVFDPKTRKVRMVKISPEIARKRKVRGKRQRGKFRRKRASE